MLAPLHGAVPVSLALGSRLGAYRIDRRIAAYALALQRIEAVYKEREIFP